MRSANLEAMTDWTQADLRPTNVAVQVEDVEAEANRRLRCIKLQQWRAREFITGQPMPEDVRHYALQVQFAAAAIARLSPIPNDFDSDIYWPRLWSL